MPGRAFAVLCLAASLALLGSTYTAGAVPTTIVCAVIVLTAVRPEAGALLAAALSPLVTSAMFSLGYAGGDWAESLVLAVAAGWCARAAIRGEPLRLGLLAAAWWVLAATVIASAVVQAAVMRQALSPEVFTPALADALWNYRTDTAGVANFMHTAARLLEGLFLLAIVTTLCAGSVAPRKLVRMFAAGATGAAIVTIARLAASALRSEHAMTTFLSLLQHVRLSVPYPDVNAAGSYFAMAVVTIAGFVAAAPRRLRPWWTFAIGISAAALWISGSRAAALAALAALACFVVLRIERRFRGAVAMALVAAAAVVVWAFPNPIVDRSAAGALNIRLELARASIRMLRLDPVFGIGIGQFYERSADYIVDPAVKAVYTRENAHNNFLQIATELGLVGFASFAALLWIVGRAAIGGWRSLEPPLGGAALGLAAFLLTCLSGHPLLTSEVSAGFWILFGCVASATRQPLAHHQSPRVVNYAAVAACVIVVASVPWRVHRDLALADLEHVGHGVSTWHRDDSGRLYREMLHDATLFVPRYAGAVELSYRLEKPGPPVTLELQFRGRIADRLVVAEDEWRTRRIVVPHDRGMPLFTPLTIKVLDGDARTVWLGKLAAIGTRE